MEDRYGTFDDGDGDVKAPLLDTNAIEIGSVAPKSSVTAVRSVYINQELRNAACGFPVNTVKTTRYTAWNFVPKNLFEQFHRIANIYFLFVVIIELIPGVAPIFPITSIMPLVLVLTVSAVKEAYEDVQRGKQDKRINLAPVRILKGTGLVTIIQESIAVGDILYLTDGEAIPADVLLLSSSDSESVAYIETMNLDGETNLKPRYSPPHTAPLKTSAALNALRGRVESGSPTPSITEYEARLLVDSVSADSTSPSSLSGAVPINAENMMWRGTKLKNTEYAYGLVVQTGVDTKLSLNSREAPSKMSNVEKLLNRIMYIVFAGLLLISLFCAIMSVDWRIGFFKSYPYLRMTQSWDSEALSFLSDLLTFIALFNQMIPISLYVTAEMVKLAGAYYVNNDLEMFDEESGQPASARTSSIQEDLGQVKHVFSDKTGTLTRNEMKFYGCAVNGKQYISQHAPNVSVTTTDTTPTATTTDEPVLRFEEEMRLEVTGVGEISSGLGLFGRVCALCHTVFVAKEDVRGDLSRPNYQASSPDELALAAFDAGIVFQERIGDAVTLNVYDSIETHEIVHTNAFDSTRKRMSVLVKNGDGTFMLMCKGAESTVLPLCEGQSEIDGVEAQVNRYATLGLRTLVFAYKNVNPDDAEKWLRSAKEAETSLVNRSSRLSAVAADIEHGLTVLGASAVEDRLQSGVPQTLVKLREAGVKVWVLTGDKMETAINIGYSSSLFHPTMKIIRIEVKKESGEGEGGGHGRVSDTAAVGRMINEALSTLPIPSSKHSADGQYENVNGEGEGVGLVITGIALDHALARYTHELYDLAERCQSVICCRMSPIQKAQVVRLVKDRGASISMDTAVEGGGSGRAMESSENDEFYSGEHRPIPVSSKAKARASIQATLKKLKLKPPSPKSVFAKPGPVTLAIGDGANDVSMIQEADVGIGIAGKEGRQAVLASDYAIGQFKFLQRLLLVHGRYSYIRITILILYSLYKNMTYNLPNFYFAFYSGFSGQTFYDSYLMMMYNVVYTSLPILALALFDKDVREATLLQFPRLYARGRLNRDFKGKSFFKWLLSVLWHSIVAFSGTLLIVGFDGRVLENGKVLGLWSIGTLCLTICIFIVSLKVMMETSLFTAYNIWGLILSIALYAGLLWPYNAIYGITPNSMFGVWWELVKSPPAWFGLLIVPAIAILPDALYGMAKRVFWPEDWMIAQEASKQVKEELQEQQHQ